MFASLWSNVCHGVGRAEAKMASAAKVNYVCLFWQLKSLCQHFFAI
jgi:hypothetical protein